MYVGTPLAGRLGPEMQKGAWDGTKRVLRQWASNPAKADEALFFRRGVRSALKCPDRALKLGAVVGAYRKSGVLSDSEIVGELVFAMAQEFKGR